MAPGKGKVVGLILAGGLARRMGGEKPLLNLHGRPLIAHAIERARPQVRELAINANDAAGFENFGCPVIADRTGGFQGPLAGVLTGMYWMLGNAPDAEWLATFACDAPFFPNDLVARLVDVAEYGAIPVALPASGGQHHPVFAVWHQRLLMAIERAFANGVRKMDDFIDLVPNVRVDFPVGKVDPFFNINTPDDLARAEKMHE